MELTEAMCRTPSRTVVNYAVWDFPSGGKPPPTHSNSMKKILQQMLRQCCKRNIVLNRTTSVEQPRDLEDVEEAFAFPIEIKTERLRYGFENPYIGVIESPGDKNR